MSNKPKDAGIHSFGWNLFAVFLVVGYIATSLWLAWRFLFGEYPPV